MLFKYKAIEKTGEVREGTIDAVNNDVAITSLQRWGLIISSLTPEKTGEGFLSMNFSLFDRVTNKDIVIVSRQVSTLFEAQVSALQIFKLLGAESDKPILRKILSQVADDLQAGSAISKALSRHGNVFSEFYINMVRAGEESGKLDETFLFLADYLERSYEVTSKAKNALVYPAFVVFTFIVVMILMLTKVIPSISQILIDSGQDIPLYTKVVLGVSSFLVDYGLFFFAVLIVGSIFLWRFAKTSGGKIVLSQTRLAIPYVGTLYTKLFLSRISSNLTTMLLSAIPIVKAIEITANVVDDAVYQGVLRDVSESVKGGKTLSESFSKHEEIPGILVQMVRVGEESGELGAILKTLSRFYEREVTNAIDTLVSLIEPVMIVLLGLGVGFLLASVLIPIYNISSAIQ